MKKKHFYWRINRPHFQTSERRKYSNDRIFISRIFAIQRTNATNTGINPFRVT